MPNINMDSTRIPIKSSTQDHLDVEDIIDDLVVLKNGNVSLVLKTTAVNFQLLSEREQDAKVAIYGALLNSLTFPLQIVIHTEKVDIRGYIDELERQSRTQTSTNLSTQIKIYVEFIKSLVVKNNVLQKSFFVIIPYINPYAAITKESFIEKIRHAVRGTRPPLANVEGILEKAKIDLYPKRDTIVKQLERMGIKSKQLTSMQLKLLYRKFYNEGEPIPYEEAKILGGFGTKKEI
jgi:type IV secretory pathway VirB4 component